MLLSLLPLSTDADTPTPCLIMLPAQFAANWCPMMLQPLSIHHVGIDSTTSASSHGCRLKTPVPRAARSSLLATTLQCTLPPLPLWTSLPMLHMPRRFKMQKTTPTVKL